MFLTAEELHNLSDYKRPAEQCRWLAEHGYRFELGASGRPKVLRSEVEKRLGTTGRSKTISPRFDLVNA